MTKAEKDRFMAKIPKKQIIKKEQLGKYLYAIEGRPDIVSRGNNWVIKDFGERINESYAQNKDIYNEYYFKKCVAAAILYRSVDNYLEQLKKIPGAWYQVGGYKAIKLFFENCNKDLQKLQITPFDINPGYSV